MRRFELPTNGLGSRCATTALHPLIILKEFILDRGQKPSFDREVGLVFCSETSLNELLLDNDHAELDPRFCGRSEFGGLDWAVKYGCGE